MTSNADRGVHLRSFFTGCDMSEEKLYAYLLDSKNISADRIRDASGMDLRWVVCDICTRVGVVSKANAYHYCPHHIQLAQMERSEDGDSAELDTDGAFCSAFKSSVMRSLTSRIDLGNDTQQGVKQRITCMSSWLAEFQVCEADVLSFRSERGKHHHRSTFVSFPSAAFIRGKIRCLARSEFSDQKANCSQSLQPLNLD